MILDYNNESNKIILETDEFKLLFKLGDYYKESNIKDIKYLKNGVIQFIVNKNGMIFEDYLSVIDTLCNEQPNAIKEEELEEKLFSDSHTVWEFYQFPHVSLEETKLAIIRFIKQLKEDI